MLVMNAIIFAPRPQVFCGFDMTSTAIDLAHAVAWGVYMDHIVIFVFAFKCSL